MFLPLRLSWRLKPAHRVNQMATRQVSKTRRQFWSGTWVSLASRCGRDQPAQWQQPSWHNLNISRSVQPALLCPHDKVYASFKFLDFPECVSKAITGASGTVDYSVRSKAMVDKELVAQMLSRHMEIQVHKQQAFHHRLLGIAHVALSDVLACFTPANGVHSSLQENHRRTWSYQPALVPVAPLLCASARNAESSHAGQSCYFQNLPIHAADSSSTIIGQVEVTSRSHGYKHWASWAAAHGNAESGVLSHMEPTGTTPLVQTVPMNPDAWPSNSRQCIVLALHTLILQPCMLRQEHDSVQVFWNLLESEVNAHSEATGELGATKASVELGKAVIYNLAGNDPAKLGARVCCCFFAKCARACVGLLIELTSSAHAESSSAKAEGTRFAR